MVQLFDRQADGKPNLWKGLKLFEKIDDRRCVG